MVERQSGAVAKGRAASGRGRRSRAGEGEGAQIASTELARKINRDIILELVRLRQPVARVDLARASGLQNSTVSSIVEQLLAEGWVREGEALRTPRGRRPTQISLNDRLAMLVADIHPGRAVVGIVDLNGKLLAQEEMAMEGAVEASMAALGDALEGLRGRHPERSLMGLGVCLPGRVNGETGRVVMAPNLHWGEYDIRGALEKRLGLKVELENDANACLLSELWFGHLDGVKNAVLLAISEGVGGALLADSHLILGRRGLAGEFGHICYKVGGVACGCGRMGCWEMYASSAAALRYYGEPVGDGAGIGYRQLAERAQGGDEAACAAIIRQSQAIGSGLRMVTASLAPEVILFAGDISYGWELARPILIEECQRTLLAGRAPRLVCTGDGRRAHLLGAAALVLQRHTEYYRSRSNERAANAQRADDEAILRSGNFGR